MTTINLETHSLKKGSKFLIKNGIPANGYVIDTKTVTFEELEQLYERYKHSVPVPKKKQAHSYFKALPYGRLSMADILQNTNRDAARTELEQTLLEGILNKSLTWPDDSKWFWQSENNRDFVLLKTWFILPEGGADEQHAE